MYGRKKEEKWKIYIYKFYTLSPIVMMFAAMSDRNRAIYYGDRSDPNSVARFEVKIRISYIDS